MKFQFRRLLLCLPLVIMLVAPVPLSAQEEVEPLEHDFGIWGDLTIKKHIVSGLSASVLGNIRTKENSSQIDQWRINPELQFKFNDYFDLSAGYIYYRSNKGIEYQGNHRWYGAVRMAVSFGPVHLHLRERFEQTIREGMEPGDYGRVYNYLRSRVGIDLKFENCPVTPYLNVENFLYVFEYKGGEVAEMRYTAGVKYKFAKIHTLDLYYRINQKFPVTELKHIMGLGYTLSF